MHHHGLYYLILKLNALLKCPNLYSSSITYLHSFCKLLIYHRLSVCSSLKNNFILQDVTRGRLNNKREHVVAVGVEPRQEKCVSRNCHNVITELKMNEHFVLLCAYMIYMLLTKTYFMWTELLSVKYLTESCSTYSFSFCQPKNNSSRGILVYCFPLNSAYIVNIKFRFLIWDNGHAEIMSFKLHRP